MTGADEQSWWARRWEAFLDNAIFWGIGVLATAAVALFAAFGTKDATLPLWLVVLFGLSQLGTVIAIVVLFRRPSFVQLQAAGEAGLPPSNQRLIAQIDALREALRGEPEHSFIPWPAASTFNSILEAAKRTESDPLLEEIAGFDPPDDDSNFSHSQDALTLLGQIRAVLEHPPSE